MEYIFEIENLEKSFGDNEVLKDINFKVKKGEVVSIIGSSGSGKSTLLRCINLLEEPNGGKIKYHGENILDDISINNYRTKVGMVFQSFNLFNNMSVLENCVIGQVKVLKKSRQEAVKLAEEFLQKVGMYPFKDAKPTSLSGGQKQRVAIAGILAMSPKYIILDEPTAMLDPSGRREVIDTLVKLNKEENKTIILITHYMEEAAISDRVVVMEDGNIVLRGKPREVFSHVDEIKKLGLDVPQVTELAHELKKDGIEISTEVLNIQEMVKEICHL